jgi:DNA end-binding protein Ku
LAARTASRPKSKTTGATRPRRASAPKSRGGARPSWSGQIRLALMNVPVQLYPAIQSGARLTFHQVDAKTGKRIRYEKTAPGVGPVDPGRILKGYEIARGEYVLLTDDELDSVKLEASRSFDLVQFVDHCEVDPIYFDKPYYVVPDGDLAAEAYCVLRDALRTTKKMGLGQIVMRGREYIAGLKPCGDGLLLETLRFADEVRAAAPLFADVRDDKADTELIDLAEELIARKAAPFDPNVFEDHYTEALRALIERKAKGSRTVTVDEGAKPPPRGAQIIDLVEALRKSVEGKSAAERKPAAKTTKAPARRRKGTG